MRYCIRSQPAPHAHVAAAPVAPPAPSTSAFSAPLAGDSGYNITTGTYGYGGGDGPYGGGASGYGYGDGSYSGGAYGYGGSDGGYGDGAYNGGPYDHGGHGGASYEAVPVGQSPGGGGAGYDIPSRPLGAPDGGYHRAMQQATEETVSPLRLRTGATRMKSISVVLFPPFSVARNRVMAPLLMSCSFEPAVAAAAPAVISRGPCRSTAVVTTAALPTGVRSSSTAAVVIVIVRNRSYDTTAATVQHCGRSSSKAPAPSVALARSRGALAAMDRR